MSESFSWATICIGGEKRQSLYIMRPGWRTYRICVLDAAPGVYHGTVIRIGHLCIDYSLYNPGKLVNIESRPGPNFLVTNKTPGGTVMAFPRRSLMERLLRKYVESPTAQTISYAVIITVLLAAAIAFTSGYQPG